ncbi:Pimeloyl-ACP methyl ester carboxylesterase [Kosakonia arachidis]|uniref:Pimeloyl-ACP methyl ester carboxylesterase n=1 Tax=Kosakonia arachidis TaxID=551989 RepID=A0A1I7D2P8_9ENTR|nr:alpha/beta hydrolase [Kosakonia arachidis]SFU05968.1 Pimeloyl-ACP methyl ester carboxylesterase [Kosakonia arachidis]
MKLNVNGTQIQVKQQGSGELALVFLHYYGGSSRTWDVVAGALSAHYRTVAIDHRGWGESAKPESGYELATLAADAQAVISALNLQRYILVGHSMGGKVAQLIASHQPTGLEGMILVAPSPPSPMRLSQEERTLLTSAYSSRESVEYVIDHVLTAKKLSAAQREQVIEDSLKGSPQAKRAWPEVAMAEDITADVAAIKIPTMVILGERDKVERRPVLEAELLPRIPQAGMHIIPEAGHLLPLEASQELTEVIARFITYAL